MINGLMPDATYRVRAYVGYNFVVDKRIVHTGVTDDPNSKEAEHKRTWPSGHLQIVTRTMTEEIAREWETTRQQAIAS